jgi:hypothetical protein
MLPPPLQSRRQRLSRTLYLFFYYYILVFFSESRQARTQWNMPSPTAGLLIVTPASPCLLAGSPTRERLRQEERGGRARAREREKFIDNQ